MQNFTQDAKKASKQPIGITRKHPYLKVTSTLRTHNALKVAMPYSKAL